MTSDQLREDKYLIKDKILRFDRMPSAAAVIHLSSLYFVILPWKLEMLGLIFGKVRICTFGILDFWKFGICKFGTI